MICAVYLLTLRSVETYVTRLTGYSARQNGQYRRLAALQASLASIASNRVPAILRSNAVSSSLMPVGLVTLISVR